jgi:hypothetical protein
MEVVCEESGLSDDGRARELLLTDKDGKSVVPADRPPRVSYNYVVEMDRQNWYVVREKVTGTC